MLLAVCQKDTCHFGGTFAEIASKHGVHDVAPGHKERSVRWTAAVVQQKMYVRIETLVKALFQQAILNHLKKKKKAV